MIETMFSAPHNATPDEVQRLYAPPEIADVNAFRAHSEKMPEEARLAEVYSLYYLRGNKEMMAIVLARIQDPDTVHELTYRDVVPTPPER